MVSNLTIILLVLVFFWICNLFIPLFLYHREYGIFKRRYKGGGGCNGWSFVMDGFVVGMLNLTVIRFILTNRSYLTSRGVIYALVIGMFVTFIAHVLMSVQKMEVWIMPKPWVWNSAGYWHMISMTLQVTFFALILGMVLTNRDLIYQSGTPITFLVFFFWLAVFYWAFKTKDVGFKIGKLTIDKEGW